MKRIITFVFVVFIMSVCPTDVQAQGFLSGLVERTKEKIKEKITNKVERSVDETMDNVLSGRDSSEENSDNAGYNEDSSNYSEDTSSAAYEESSYEETNNSASDEDDNIVQVVLTPWAELPGIGVEGVEQIALVAESQKHKIFEDFEDKLTGDIEMQMLKRNLDENNKAVIREMVRKAKSYSLGNRLYSQVFFPRNGDLIVVSTSQKPRSNCGEWGAIDKTGKVVIPLTHFQFTRDASWMDALFFVDKEHGKEGAYHLNGKLRVPFKYESIKPERTGNKNWFITYENGKNVLYDENMNKKLTADHIDIIFGTINGKDDTYIYTYDGTGAAKDYKNYDENLNRIIEQ